MRDRTADLLRARQALSQLSYNPIVILISVTLIRFRARHGDGNILQYVSIAITQHGGEFGRPEWT